MCCFLLSLSLVLLCLALYIHELHKLSAEFDSLKSEVASAVVLMAQAVSVINALAAQVAGASANTVDPATVTQLTSDLKAGADALSTAVAAHPAG